MFNKTLFILTSLVFVQYAAASQVNANDKRPAVGVIEEGEANKKFKTDSGAALVIQPDANQADVKHNVDQAIAKQDDEASARIALLTQLHSNTKTDVLSFQAFSAIMTSGIEIALKDSLQVKSFQRHFNQIKPGYAKLYDGIHSVRQVAGNPKAQPVSYTDTIDECARQFDVAVAQHQGEHNEKMVAGEKLKIALAEYNAYLSKFVADSFHELREHDAKADHEEHESEGHERDEKADQEETWNISPALLPALIKSKHMPIMQWSAQTAVALKQKHATKVLSQALKDTVVDASHYGIRRVVLGDIKLADFGAVAAKAVNDDHDVECALCADHTVRFLVKKKAYGNLVVCNAVELALFDDLYKAYHAKQDEQVVQLLAQCDAKVRNPVLRANLMLNYEFEKTAQRLELRKRAQFAATVVAAQAIATAAETAAAK